MGYTFIISRHAVGPGNIKQNRSCTSMSCWHCNTCIIIGGKCMALLGTALNVVPISENRQSKSELNTTSGEGYMEVKVKTK